MIARILIPLANIEITIAAYSPRLVGPLSRVSQYADRRHPKHHSSTRHWQKFRNLRVQERAAVDLGTKRALPSTQCCGVLGPKHSNDGPNAAFSEPCGDSVAVSKFLTGRLYFQ